LFIKQLCSWPRITGGTKDGFSVPCARGVRIDRQQTTALDGSPSASRAYSIRANQHRRIGVIESALQCHRPGLSPKSLSLSPAGGVLAGLFSGPPPRNPVFRTEADESFRGAAADTEQSMPPSQRAILAFVQRASEITGSPVQVSLHQERLARRIASEPKHQFTGDDLLRAIRRSEAATKSATAASPACRGSAAAGPQALAAPD
jgi:hypothetical protein